MAIEKLKTDAQTALIDNPQDKDADTFTCSLKSNSLQKVCAILPKLLADARALTLVSESLHKREEYWPGRP